jgi:hypothetical protein
MSPTTNITRVGRSGAAMPSRSTDRRALVIALAAMALIAMCAAGCRGPKGPHIKAPGVHIH